MPTVDFAQLVKVYGASPDSAKGRYSQRNVLELESGRSKASPTRSRQHVIVERQNLTMRMHMRRFTRLTNAFSKKVENHIHMVALYTVFYNYCRIHKTLRVTPAMEAGLSDTVRDMNGLLN